MLNFLVILEKKNAAITALAFSLKEFQILNNSNVIGKQ